MKALFCIAVLFLLTLWCGCAVFETSPEDVQRKFDQGGYLTPGVPEPEEPFKR